MRKIQTKPSRSKKKLFGQNKILAKAYRDWLSSNILRSSRLDVSGDGILAFVENEVHEVVSKLVKHCLVTSTCH